MTGQGCTCGGIAPGYPMHEDFCGRPEDDERDDELESLVAADVPADAEVAS